LLLLAALGTGTLWAGKNVWTSIGPSGGSAHALAADPVNPGTVYAGTSRGVLKTTDGGTTWQLANSGLPPGIHILAIDPTNPGTIYAGLEANGQPAIFKTTDAGANWKPAFSGLESSVQEVESIAIDPHDSGTIYAGTMACFQSSGAPGFVPGGENLCFRPGVFKSVNGGASWTSVSDGLPWDSEGYGTIAALAIDPRNSDTIYAASRRGVFRTTNAGASWTRLSIVLAGTTLIVDPQNSNTIYLSSWNGIYTSIDAGASWSRLGSGLRSDCCGSFALDPGDSHHPVRRRPVWRLQER